MDCGLLWSDPNLNAVSVYHLHLELDDDWVGEENKEDFLKLSKAERSISRDVLVPFDMTLRALHYVIQKLFGWQNSHLHNFSLSEEDFDLITAGRLGPYADLCGSIFRFPSESMENQDWDDDYEPDRNPKQWFRKKYSRPFHQCSIRDTWIGGQMELKDFRKEYPHLADDAFLVDVSDECYFEQKLNTLSEGLLINDVFAKFKTTEDGVSSRPDVHLWKYDMMLETREAEDAWAEANQAEVLEIVKQLQQCRESYDVWKQSTRLDPERTEKEAIEEYGIPLDLILIQHERQIAALEELFDYATESFSVSPLPFFDTIEYTYDYGDSWNVKITVEEGYRLIFQESDENFMDMDDFIDPTETWRYVDSEGKEVSEDLNEQLITVDLEGTPICIAADGLSVLDDCGGVCGYLRMLHKLNGKDKEEKDSMRSWAKSQGWTGRKSMPKNML